jgi:hypothetical protein
MTQTAQNQSKASSPDIRINPPPPAAQAAPAVRQLPSPAATEGMVIQRESATDAGDLSRGDAFLGIGILVSLAIVFLFVRGAVRTSLIRRKASPSAASSTSWALFAFLFFTALTLTWSFFGSFWGVWQFSATVVALVVLSLLLFLTMYNSAAKGCR